MAIFLIFNRIKGSDSLNFEPAFDRQKDIYLDMFKKLEEANTLLSFRTAIDAAAIRYIMVMCPRWRKFGNSLYLRLLMRISGKQEVSAHVIAKIKEMVDDKSAEYPMIANNEESAVLRWTGIAPYISPLNTVREQDFRAPAIASFFIDNLVNWSDPRIDIPTYGTSGINRWGIAASQGAYVGVPSGYAPGSEPVKRSFFLSNTSAASLQTDAMTGIMMNFAEVQFILSGSGIERLDQW